jgi:hypothetical protein
MVNIFVCGFLHFTFLRNFICLHIANDAFVTEISKIIPNMKVPLRSGVLLVKFLSYKIPAVRKFQSVKVPIVSNFLEVQNTKAPSLISTITNYNF